MKRLPPAKRNQLIGVILGTAALICAVYFLLIGPQNTKNAELGTNIGKEGARLGDIKKQIRQMEATSNTLAGLTLDLNRSEADIAYGDLSAWTFDTMRRFKTGYHVDIPMIGQPSLGDCDLISNFPYRQIRFSVSGSAFYHDLGKFIADFENKFPHCRVLNLVAEPVGSTGAGEKLNFRMDVVALVKPNS